MSFFDYDYEHEHEHEHEHDYEYPLNAYLKLIPVRLLAMRSATVEFKNSDHPLLTNTNVCCIMSPMKKLDEIMPDTMITTVTDIRPTKTAHVPGNARRGCLLRKNR